MGWDLHFDLGTLSLGALVRVGVSLELPQLGSQFARQKPYFPSPFGH